MSECTCVDTGHKQDCPLGKDLRIAAMQEQIAILETSLAERWESLNVQDGIIDGLQEEIAALRAEKLTDASALRLALERIAALEKVAERPPWKEEPLNCWTICGMNHYFSGGLLHLFVSMTRRGRCITAEGLDSPAIWESLKAQALREAGYGGGE